MCDQDADSAWRALRQAAEALGIDPSTLPSPEAMAERQKAQEPEPEPELVAPFVSDDEWELIAAQVAPRKKYLSRIPPRAFVDACLHWAYVGKSLPLVPTHGWGPEALRNKMYRSFSARLFTALVSNPDFDRLSDQNRALLNVLADAERKHVERRAAFQAEQLRKIKRQAVAAKKREA